jgi:ectoine hydroxylase-related dioxygenase (phytanoyl-CoA dioxygenase family)
MINSEILQQYENDGATVVRDCLSDEWLDLLRKAVEHDIENPGPMVLNYIEGNQSTPGGRFHGNVRIWETDNIFRDFCLNSPLPKLAAKFLSSKKINLFYDQLFVKEPGMLNRTRWHNDQPYWSMRGWQILSFWIALDPVNARNGALEFIRGSHRWGRWFEPEGTRDYERNPDYEIIPDIEADRDQYEIISWDLSPGDVYVFHALTVHGAGGNQSSDVRRRGYTVRYTGDDVVYDTRLGTNKNLHSDMHKDGDLLDSERYPVVWRK